MKTSFVALAFVAFASGCATTVRERMIAGRGDLHALIAPARDEVSDRQPRAHVRTLSVGDPLAIAAYPPSYLRAR